MVLINFIQHGILLTFDMVYYWHGIVQRHSNWWSSSVISRNLSASPLILDIQIHRKAQCSILHRVPIRSLIFIKYYASGKNYLLSFKIEYFVSLFSFSISHKNTLNRVLIYSLSQLNWKCESNRCIQTPWGAWFLVFQLHNLHTFLMFALTLALILVPFLYRQATADFEIQMFEPSMPILSIVFHNSF